MTSLGRMAPCEISEVSSAHRRMVASTIQEPMRDIWEDSRRRIDLLAIDKEAKLVVIELKRTQDGGHMDLQAIRYASMVSAMTFERAVQIHADFLQNQGDPPEEARSRILGFLGWSEASEDDFADDVRILLVSEDFGKELTTAVLWLRDRAAR